MKRIIALFLIVVLMLSCTACGADKAVDLTALYAELESSLPDMLVLDEGTMLNYLGINSADCTQVVAAVSIDGLRADEIWLVEAKDSATAESIAALAERRIDAKKDETINYTPDQYLIVEKAELITNGNLVILLVSPDVDALKAVVTEAIK